MKRWKTIKEYKNEREVRALKADLRNRISHIKNELDQLMSQLNKYYQASDEYRMEQMSHMSEPPMFSETTIIWGGK